MNIYGKIAFIVMARDLQAMKILRSLFMADGKLTFRQKLNIFMGFFIVIIGGVSFLVALGVLIAAQT